jgi:hypothetical protein
LTPDRVSFDPGQGAAFARKGGGGPSEPLVRRIVRPTRIRLEAIYPHPSDPSQDERVGAGSLLARWGERLEISRRSFFGLAGASAFGLAPAARAIASALLGSYEVIRRRNRVLFRLAGVVRWVIDTRRFGGRPRLSVVESRGLVRVALQGATLPGTGLPRT